MPSLALNEETPPFMLSSSIVNIMKSAGLLAIAAVAFGQSANRAANDGSHVVLDTMAQELQRNFDALKKKADPAPYFLSYEITDQDTHTISATLGVLNGSDAGRSRYLDVTVRVGDPKLDNFRRVRGERVEFTGGAAVPIDDAVAPLRQDLWLETDRVYRASAERLIKIKTNQQVKAADRDASSDFSSEESYAHVEAPATIRFDQKRWTDSVRDLSRDFVKYPDLLSSDVQVSFQSDTRYFANTEGTKVQHGRDFSRVMITASAKAKDGMDVSDFESFEAADPKDLPSGDVIKAAVKKVGEQRRSTDDARRRPNLLWARRSFPAARPAFSSMKSSAIALKATGRRTNPKARRSPRALAKRSCPSFFR